jgi:recombination protein RecT
MEMNFEKHATADGTPPPPSNQLAQKAADKSHAVEIKKETQTEPLPPPAVRDPSPSERFQMAVEKQFSSDNGWIDLTAYQRKLIRNYFIKIDMVLKLAETKRMAKDERYRDDLAFTWQNVNMQQLAVDVIAWSGVGLDPTQPNHLNPIPYKNKHTKKYDFTFIEGYMGKEVKVRKYGIDIPTEVIVELIYDTDKFKAYKKDKDHPVENYTFEIVDEFARGKVKGGFWYFKYNDAPHKNRIKVFTKTEIDKRKPDYASAEFWGGEKDVWGKGEDGKSKVIGKEQVEGWYEEMAWKTISRNAWNSIPIDSEKIDDHFMAVIQKENEWRDKVLIDVRAEIDDKGNKKPLEITGSSESVNEVPEEQPKAKKEITPEVTDSEKPGW